MVALSCPLCCNETFSSHTSLKCHILNILENLSCPSCNEKFEKLSELVEHLENDCLELLLDNSETLDKSEDSGGEIVASEDSILAKALLGNSSENGQEGTEESQYYCQMCCVHLDDIQEHLKNFHEGQDAILEEDDVEGAEEAEDVEEHTVYIIDPNVQEGNTSTETEVNPTPINRLDTISQEEFKDKEGRLYTRKLVKIDKFWVQDQEDNTAETTQTMQKFVIDSDKDEESIIEIQKCPTCYLYFPGNREYGTHNCPGPAIKENKKVHAGPYNCEVCNTTFPTFKSLRLHRRMHEPIKAREVEAPAKYGLKAEDNDDDQVRQMFVCKICNKTYDRQYEFIHMSSHDSSNGFNCDICNRKFYTETNLEMHMKAHSNNKKFTCSYCKKPFVTYDALNDHLSNQCQKRQYACQFCGRRFARPHEKVKHERIHTGEKPHVCDICGKAFRVSYCLTLHLRTHSGTRPYQCKNCGKRFKSHSVYNHHLLTHSDVRAYKCPYCPKAFKTSVQLAGHKNSHLKPFTCTDCNRPFASLYAVRAHMETHKRDNNLKYECWMCGALYSRAFALKDHLKQQHHLQQQVEGDKVKAEALVVDEEMVATHSILVNEDDIILGLDSAANIEVIDTEDE